MKASALLSSLKGQPYGAYEAAVVDAARTGQLIGWPLVPLTLEGGGHKVTLRVASDYLAVGEPSDLLRTPLLPLTAQRICDALGMSLPTTHIAAQIWKAATLRLTPTPMVPNLGPSLQQFADHSAAIEHQRTLTGQPWGALSNGQKKDIVVSKMLKPGKVIIYGWFWPDDPTIHGPYFSDNLRASNPIQQNSAAHGQEYVDYSHGVRLVCRECLADGGKADLFQLLQDPNYAACLTAANDSAPGDFGPFTATQARYGQPLQETKPVVPYAYDSGEHQNPADRGLDAVRTSAANRQAGS